MARARIGFYVPLNVVVRPTRWDGLTRRDKRSEGGMLGQVAAELSNLNHPFEVFWIGRVKVVQVDGGPVGGVGTLECHRSFTFRLHQADCQPDCWSAVDGVHRVRVDQHIILFLTE